MNMKQPSLLLSLLGACCLSLLLAPLSPVVCQVSPTPTDAPDAIPPNVAFTTPADGAYINTFDAIGGTVVDNMGGSGVARVDLYIQRNSDKTYWTGAVWASLSIPLPTRLSFDNTWAIDRNILLPQGQDLVNTDYTLSAQAFDQAGNSSSATVSVTINTAAPTISITAPTRGATITNLTSIVGKATNNPSGTAIAQVNVAILRYDGVSWNGTFWSEAPASLEAFRSYNNWSVTDQLPNGIALADGSYTIVATVVDKAGNSVSVSRSMMVDRSAPEPAIIISPEAGALLSKFRGVRGQANDNAGGSGVQRVNLFLQRRSDNLFWDGATWSSAHVALPTVLSGTSWMRNSGFPSGASLTDGSYYLSTATVDKAGNSTFGPAIAIAIDRTAPTLTIIAPASNGGLKDLSTIGGLVVDNPQGSGVSRIDLYLQRLRDGRYWTGTSWVITPTALKTRLSSGTWACTTALPTRPNLPDGSYVITARAYDGIGNSARVTRQIVVDTAAPATVTFTTPRAGAVVASLENIQGTATDNPGGSGIDHVEL
ncbi:MAG: Ig-like domain repeat protein, partial [Abitibacteriaceae bacterium]|nr:Ig-like domain repeat protein [Abditibacteriaceae bacterium]